MKKKGMVFYSNSIDFLSGVALGASFVNDRSFIVHDIESSDKAEYSLMLYLEDPEDYELQEHFA